MDWLFSTDDWPARWHCGVWPAWLGWGTVLGNFLIAFAYYLIPFFAWRLFRKKPELFVHRKLAFWSGLFVVMCGTTHLLDGMAFWWPAYRLNLFARVITAYVSLYTLVLFTREWPALLSYIGPEKARRLLEERDGAYTKLQKVHRALMEQHLRDQRQIKELEVHLQDVREQTVSMESGDSFDPRVVGEKIRKDLHAIRNSLRQPIADALADFIQAPPPAPPEASHGSAGTGSDVRPGRVTPDDPPGPAI